MVCPRYACGNPLGALGNCCGGGGWGRCFALRGRPPSSQRPPFITGNTVTIVVIIILGVPRRRHRVRHACLALLAGGACWFGEDGQPVCAEGRRMHGGESSLSVNNLENLRALLDVGGSARPALARTPGAQTRWRAGSEAMTEGR